MKNKRFTLLELLTVIAIFGLLISMLLPALTRSRELSRRTVCLSNLKQNYTMFFQFAKNNNKKLPFMYSDYKQFNYSIYRGNLGPGMYTGFGALIRDEYVSSPEGVMYCPTTSGIANFQKGLSFNGSNNPWPFIHSGSVNVRSSYSFRALGDLRDIPNYGQKYTDRNYTGYPTLYKLESNEAILSDIFVSINSNPIHYGEGRNALNADGSGSWKSSSKEWQKYLNAVPAKHAKANNSLLDAAWNVLGD